MVEEMVAVPIPSEELYHHGVKGMKWYRHQFGDWEEHAVYANGQPDPNADDDNRKMSRAERKEREYEEAKARALRSGSAADILKFKGDLTNEELNKATERLRLEKTLAASAAADAYAQTGMAKAEQFFNKVGKVSNMVKTTSEAIENVNKLRNNLATLTGKDDKKNNKTDQNQQQNNKNQQQNNQKQNGKKPKKPSGSDDTQDDQQNTGEGGNTSKKPSGGGDKPPKNPPGGGGNSSDDQTVEDGRSSSPKDNIFGRVGRGARAAKGAFGQFINNPAAQAMNEEFGRFTRNAAGAAFDSTRQAYYDSLKSRKERAREAADRKAAEEIFKEQARRSTVVDADWRDVTDNYAVATVPNRYDVSPTSSYNSNRAAVSGARYLGLPDYGSSSSSSGNNGPVNPSGLFGGRGNSNNSSSGGSNNSGWASRRMSDSSTRSSSDLGSRWAQQQMNSSNLFQQALNNTADAADDFIRRGGR